VFKKCQRERERERDVQQLYIVILGTKFTKNLKGVWPSPWSRDGSGIIDGKWKHKRLRKEVAFGIGASVCVLYKRFQSGGRNWQPLTLLFSPSLGFPSFPLFSSFIFTLLFFFSFFLNHSPSLSHHLFHPFITFFFIQSLLLISTTLLESLIYILYIWFPQRKSTMHY